MDVRKIKDVIGDKSGKQDFKAHVTMMKLSKMRNSKVRKISPSLYRSMKDLSFGHEIARNIQLLSMMKPKQSNGYYTCEGHVNIDKYMPPQISGRKTTDFCLSDWAESLSIACITRALYCACCKDSFADSRGECSEVDVNPNKKIKLILDPGG